MGKERANIGSLQERGVIPLLEDAYRSTWCGALRLTTSQANGAIWFVRGQAVHAACETSSAKFEGMAAFEAMIGWNQGSYLLDCEVLPPARAIRLPMSDLILAAKQSARRMTSVSSDLYVPRSLHQRLDSIMETLRQRVPGIESISVLSHDEIEASTTWGEEEREWVGTRLKILSASPTLRPETLFLKQEGRALLVIGDEEEATVVSATEDTTPEAVFWAGMEARRRIKSTSEEIK